MENKIQNKLLKTSTEKLYNMFSSLEKKVRANEKKNKVMYHKMSDIFTVFGYKLRIEAEKKGFKEGVKVRIKEAHELPKHLRSRRNKGLSWENYDISGERQIGLIYANKNTGFPSIDDDKPELIVNLHPPLQHKNNKGMSLPLIVRLSDIELIKK